MFLIKLLQYHSSFRTFLEDVIIVIVDLCCCWTDLTCQTGFPPGVITEGL